MMHWILLPIICYLFFLSSSLCFFLLQKPYPSWAKMKINKSWNAIWLNHWFWLSHPEKIPTIYSTKFILKLFKWFCNGWFCSIGSAEDDFRWWCAKAPSCHRGMIAIRLYNNIKYHSSDEIRKIYGGNSWKLINSSQV